MSSQGITRREFFCRTVAAAATVAIVPRHVLGGPGQTPPSETITRGVIGTGGQGTGAHVTQNQPGQTPVTLAVCDVDKNHLAGALRKAGPGCEGYTDFRRVLDRKDIDTIHIATPPHWHALICIAAAQAGKDILCEKPMTRFIREGRAVIDAVRRYGRVFQIGTYGRFRNAQDRNQRMLRKMGMAGLFAKNPPVIVVRENWKVKEWSGRTDLRPQPVPSELDYDMWLGPAPVKPYHPHRVHGSFRGYWDYDGGGLADMGQHYLDPIQYTIGKDDDSPVEIEAHAPWPPHPDAVGLWGWVKMKYRDGTTLILDSREWGEPVQEQTRWPSESDLSAEDRRRLAQLPDPEPLIDFHTAVRTRKQPGGDAVSSHRSACLLHLANIAIRTGRKLRYDPVAERFIGDDEANRLVDVPMRSPWHL